MLSITDTTAGPSATSALSRTNPKESIGAYPGCPLTLCGLAGRGQGSHGVFGGRCYALGPWLRRRAATSWTYRSRRSRTSKR